MGVLRSCRLFRIAALVLFAGMLVSGQTCPDTNKSDVVLTNTLLKMRLAMIGLERQLLELRIELLAQRLDREIILLEDFERQLRETDPTESEAFAALHKLTSDQRAAVTLLQTQRARLESRIAVLRSEEAVLQTDRIRQDGHVREPREKVADQPR